MQPQVLPDEVQARLMKAVERKMAAKGIKQDCS
jgi:hypothetical protein